MSDLIIYQKPTCNTCRQVVQVLKESGVDFKFVNYYLEPISSQKLKQLLRKMNMSAAELIRKKEPAYKELRIAEKNFSEEELIDLMAQHPDLIQRPIIEMGSRAILARPAEKLREFMAVGRK
jgi:arsenate reductase